MLCCCASYCLKLGLGRGGGSSSLLLLILFFFHFLIFVRHSSHFLPFSCCVFFLYFLFFLFCLCSQPYFSLSLSSVFLLHPLFLMIFLLPLSLLLPHYFFYSSLSPLPLHPPPLCSPVIFLLLLLDSLLTFVLISCFFSFVLPSFQSRRRMPSPRTPW